MGAPLEVPDLEEEPAIPPLETWKPGATKEDGSMTEGIAASDLAKPPPEPVGPPAPQRGPPEAYGRFLTGLGALGPNASAAELGSLYRSYFSELGFPVLDAPPGKGVFEDKNVLTFTHPVGDVDGDGAHDLALDQFCTQASGCRTTPPLAGDPAALAGYTDGAICGPPHRLTVVSGREGHELWSRRLDAAQPAAGDGPALPNSCAQEFVVGTVPLGDARHGLLVYRYVVTALTNWAARVEHEYYLVDPVEGHEHWSHMETGEIAALQLTLHARNLLLLPVLQVPPPDGVALIDRETETALFLQAVGFELSFVDSRVTPPGYDNRIPLVDLYAPNEEAARIDLASGREAWRVQTFQPRAERSVMPAAVASPSPFGRPDEIVRRKSLWFWYQQPCCFDSTGDGVPDLLYWTREWSTTPAHNPDGPHMVEANVVLFDGASGQRVYERNLERDTPRGPIGCEFPYCVRVLPQLLGDANGDGRADLALHAVQNGFDFVHTLIVLNGPDGAELWRERFPRAIDVLVLGDADGDGGNDFVYHTWHHAGTWFMEEFNSYDFANVTETPLMVRSGATGKELWRASTFQAPIDLALGFDTMRLNGVPDFDLDGVGDFSVDDPVYYPDLTVVHRHAFLSGSDGHVVYRMNSVGAFSFPALAGDLNRDGEPDLLLVNGDINDLWITTYDGATDDALWSRRILASRQSNYVTAVARVRSHPLNLEEAAGCDNLLVNLHFQVETNGGFIGVQSNTPQLAAYRGVNGTAGWALPEFEQAALAAVLVGATPLTEAFNAAYDVPVSTAYSAASYPPAMRAAIGAVLFVVSALGAFAATQRRRPS